MDEGCGEGEDARGEGWAVEEGDGEAWGRGGRGEDAVGRCGVEAGGEALDDLLKEGKRVRIVYEGSGGRGR